MDVTLLDRFLDEALSDGVAEEVLRQIAQPGMEQACIVLDALDLRIDLLGDRIVVEDELDAGSEQELSLRPFLDLLRRHAHGTSAEHGASTGSARRRPGGPQVAT